MARKTARLGRQTPTQALVLPYDETKGGETVELYEQGGRTAMDWQKVLLYDMMAVDDDGLWVHSKFGLSVPRRNGKSEVDKMRELWGLFHGEHILHTAHRTTKHSAWIFTHVPLAGDDRVACTASRACHKFLPTSPLRGTTARRERVRAADPISTHVPLAGDDPASCEPRPSGPRNFYPRPPCGGRPQRRYCEIKRKKFLSTSPLRGTTTSTISATPLAAFLSASPLRGTTIPRLAARRAHAISIHVPLAGDD